MTVRLLPADAYNERTISQGHPPNWQNPPGGTYDLVILGGGPAVLVAALTAAAAPHSIRWPARSVRRKDGRGCPFPSPVRSSPTDEVDRRIAPPTVT